MTTDELVQGVQFTVDRHGHVTAVVLTPELWRRIAEALEDAEDRELVRALRDKLAAGPAVSGALRWQDVADESTTGRQKPAACACSFDAHDPGATR